MKILLFFVVALPFVLSESTILLNLTPEEAQRYIDGSSSVLNYAPKLGVEPLPTDKKSYYQGKVIEQPQAFLQENYNANQFHGQNGLGQAKFGYSDWNQARVENINAHGKTEGSYKYVDPTGENYEVQYWADSSGFHRTDNRPVAELVPVTDTPEVKAAIEAHQKAWSEAAAANGVASQFPQQPQTYSQVPQPEANEYEEKYKYVHQEEKYDGPTGKPYGFYYNFDYPVHLILEKGAVHK